MNPKVGNTRPNMRGLLAQLPQRRQWQGIVVLGLMLVGAVAELLTLGAVLPFLAVIADPTATQRYPQLGASLSQFGLQSHEEAILGLAICFSLIAVAAAAIRILLAWASQKFVFRLGYDLGVALYRRILYQPYSFHVARNTSEVVAAIQKVQSVVTGMLLPLMQAIIAVVIALFIFGGLLIINAGVALGAGLGFGLLYLFVSLATRRRLRNNGRIIAATQTQRIQTVQEGLGGIRDVLLDHAQPLYIQKFARLDSSLRDAQATNALIAAAPRFVIEGAGMVMIAMLALVLSRQPGGLMASLPVLGALAIGAQRLLPLLQLVYNGWTQIMGNRAVFFDVLELLDRSPRVSQPVCSVEPLPFTRSISLKDVKFCYSENGPLVLRGINIDIPKGARVGFVGKTGSGKSTIMDLLLGLLSPTSGSIEIDSQSLGSNTAAAWQVQVAHVPQQIYLSDASVLENIAFGVPRDQIDEKRARAAAQKADIGEFIEEQPHSYNTIVGERGVRLSGGQRQRIGIARALYKRSTVLVFDEATSALDDATEASVMEAIDRLGRDLTVLMIAHRVTTLRNCDVIYRIERGAVVRQGRYKDVVPATRVEGAPETQFRGTG